MDERWGIEVNAKGHKFKLNRDFGGYHLTNRGGPDVDAAEAIARWDIPPPDSLRRHGAILEVEDVSFAYTPPNNVLSRATLNLQPGSKIGIVGESKCLKLN